MKTPNIELPKGRGFHLVGRIERLIRTESGPDLQVVSYPAPSPTYRTSDPSRPVIDPDDLCAWLYERSIESTQWRLILDDLDPGLGERIERMSEAGLGWQSDEGHRIMLIVHDWPFGGWLRSYAEQTRRQRAPLR